MMMRVSAIARMSAFVGPAPFRKAASRSMRMFSAQPMPGWAFVFIASVLHHPQTDLEHRKVHFFNEHPYGIAQADRPARPLPEQLRP